MGWIPLHYALRNNAPSDVVQLLLEHHPAGAGIVDHQGCTALHIACRHGASLEVMKNILEANTQSISSVDRNGCAPLHIACRHGASLDVIKTLFAADETVLTALDHREELPIHKAYRGGRVSIVCYLVETNMPTCAVRNKEGILPIFILCGKSKANKEVPEPEYLETIWQLLLAHPETVLSN